MKYSPDVPECIGPYRVDGPLAAGGMGQVYRAYDERLRRAVAIKRLREERMDDTVARQRLHREAQAVAALNHPAIVQIHDLLETDSGDWLVMELVPGQNLVQVLTHGALPIPSVLDMGAQIAEGLEAAHAAGIVHRDLKDANVMVTPARQIKLLDFGIAKHVQATAQTTLSQPGTVVGTVHAMAPEQAMGLDVDARADLFSLGALLYQMISSEPPFLAKTTGQTLARVCSYQPPPLRACYPEVPAALSRLVDQLLQKDPLHRPQSARQVVAELREIQQLVETQQQLAAPDLGPVHAGALETDTRIDLEAPSLQPGEQASRRRSSRWHSLASKPAALALLLALVVGIVIASPMGRQGLRSVLAPAADSLDAPPESASPPASAKLSNGELYQQGMTLLLRFDRPGNIDQALGRFQQLLDRDSSSAAGQAGLARAFWRKYRGGERDPVFLQQATIAAEAAVEADPFLADAQVSLGLVRFDQGRNEEAAQHFQTALDLDPANADAQWGLGRLHEAAGRIRDALAAYRGALARRPDDRMLHDTVGALYFRQACYDQAAAAFQDSIALAPDSFYGYRSLASVYYLQGRYEEAATLVQQALSIQPSATLYSSLGTLLFAQGQYAKASDAFERALETGGHQYLYWSNLGDALRWTSSREQDSQRAYRQALRLLDAEIERRPDDATAGSRRALIRAKIGETDPAMAELRRVDALGGTNATTDYRAAVTLELSGQREQALERLWQALGAGFSRTEAERDPELIELRVDPRFHRLLLDLETQPPASSKCQLPAAAHAADLN